MGNNGNKRSWGETLEFLFSIKRIPPNPGLDHVKEALSLLGNPEKRIRAIHVGGTNGKGSTCATVAKILRESGYKAGMYTSPHLLDIRERIMVGGGMITPERLSSLIWRIAHVMERYHGKGARELLTFFEYLTVAAFLHFDESDCDVSVVEVGMGGRWDATNVLKPLLSIITNIDLDHTQILGDTKLKIAYEKAGIIKEGGVLLTAESDPRILEYLKSTCLERGSSFMSLHENASWGVDDKGLFYYRGHRINIENVSLSLRGGFQRVNAATSAMACEIASENGFGIYEMAVKSGMRKVKWPGRLEVLRRNPMIIMDGAHNPAGIKALSGALEEEFPEKKKTFIAGFLLNKDFREMIKEISPHAKRIIAVGISGADSVPVEEIRAQVESLGIEALSFPSLRKALGNMEAWFENGDHICITGSLYLVSEAKSIGEFRVFEESRAGQKPFHSSWRDLCPGIAH